MRRPALWIVAMLVGLAFLGLASRHLRFDDVVAALGRAQLWPWLPLGVASYLAGHLIRGMRLRRLVRRETLLNTADATNVVIVGYSVNNVLPARLGEIARAWMLMERSGLSFMQTLTVTASERLLDAAVLLLALGVATSLLPVGTLEPAALRFITVLAGGGLIVLAVGVLFPARVLAIATRLAHRWAPHRQDSLLRVAHAAVNGVSGLRRPRTALAVVGLTVLVWMCEAGLYLALLPAFGLAADPVHALFAMTNTNVGILVPSTPGFVGPFHFFCSRAMVAVGVPADVSFAYAALVHVAFFVPVTVWGIGVLAVHGLSVGATLNLSRTAEPLLSPDTLQPLDLGGDTAAPSRFHLALVAAAVPLEETFQSGADRERAQYEVATFVAGQMQELPTRLRAAFAIGLLAFRVATRLRFGSGFCDLPPGPRREWFETWAYGRWRLGRQLFRAVRSTALLAWYEIPAARAALDEGHLAQAPAAGSPS